MIVPVSHLVNGATNAVDKPRQREARQRLWKGAMIRLAVAKYVWYGERPCGGTEGRDHAHRRGGGGYAAVPDLSRFICASYFAHPSRGAMFFPPVGFGLVEEGLYRSALPNEINFPFLERLRLKTIIYLYPDDDIDAQL